MQDDVFEMTQIASTSNKPVIVLLRGLFRDQRHWGTFPMRLQQQLPEYHVLCLDTLGNGELSQQVSPLKMEEYAQYLLKQLECHQVRSCMIIGLSLGAMIGICALAASPGHISHVIAINSSCRLSPWWQRFNLPFALNKLLRAKKHTHCSRLEQGILQFTSTQQRDNHTLLKQWSKYRQANHTRMINGIRQIIAAARFIPAPMLIGQSNITFIVGGQDKLVRPACSQALADYVKAPCYQVADAAHDLPLDQPQALIDLIKEIMSGHPYKAT